MCERYTDRARKVMQLANEEAHRFGHDYIGTGHILVGLAKDGSGTGANVLKRLGVELGGICREVEKVFCCREVEKFFPRETDSPLKGELFATPRARAAVQHALEEARRQDHDYVGTAHLLLGLMREENGLAAQVLMNLGLRPDQVRQTILDALAEKEGGEEIAPGIVVLPDAEALARPAPSPPPGESTAEREAMATPTRQERLPESFDPSRITRPDPALLKYYFLTSLLGVPVFPLVLLPLFFKYETLRYRFDSSGVSMSWGILWRREIHLTYRRIQDIHLTRNIIQRWMGLATVAIQTASGSSGPEMSIEGILQADQLRDYLYAQMRGARADSGPRAAAEAGSGAGAPAAGEADEALGLLREIRDLLRRVARAEGGGA